MFKKLTLIACCIVLLLAMLSGCEKGNAAPSASDASPPAGESERTEPAVSEPAAPGDFSVTAVEGAIAIDTGYGRLFFPEQWTELLRTEREVGEGYVKITFSAALDGTVYPLFEIAVGDYDGGSHIGSLTDGNGVARNVRMELISLRDVTDLPEDELDWLYAMQEDVNYLINGIK
ncbi:MAG: hypothetical protein J1E00_02110 [Oscillospiraceae bacterium]|nr:hypothetical protein [Oscillospiraceae bacterium]